MEFCQKCGSVLIEKGSKYGCARCGYSTKNKIKITAIEKMPVKQKLGVVKEKEIDIFPITSATCQKCGHNEAYFWTSQTRSGDEAETRFFKCVKCKHTWREYK